MAQGRNNRTGSRPTDCGSKYQLVMIPPVKRLCLILLILLLPIQMSWAAIHICDDDLGQTAFVQAVQQSQHDHEQVSEKAGSPGEKTHAADACCFTGHGCHGLHSLMASESSQAKLPDSSHALNGLNRLSNCGAISARHERPKWPAA